MKLVNMSKFINDNEGWICPRYKTVLSPNVTICPKCKFIHDDSKPNFEDLEMDPNKNLHPLNS